MNPIVEKVYQIGIIPVIAFNSVDEALPLCKALADGGLPAAEVTFRTACAEECIRKIHEEMPEMLLGAGTVLTTEQADRAMAAGASFIVAPGFDPEVCKHVIDKGGIMMPGTCSAGEMQQAMNMGCEALKFFPAEANGGVGMLKNIGAALKSARWMCTGGVNAKNVNDYLGYDQIFAVGGTWMCKSDVIKAGDWAKITAQSKEAVDTMLGLKLMHIGINTENEEEAMKLANLIGSLLNMKVAPGNSSIFVGNKEFEIMKKVGRGTNGHIAIGCNNVDRAIYHLSQRGAKFDLDSKVVKNGKTIACYFADEIGGFDPLIIDGSLFPAFHNGKRDSTLFLFPIQGAKHGIMFQFRSDHMVSRYKDSANCHVQPFGRIRGKNKPRRICSTEKFCQGSSCFIDHPGCPKGCAS